MRGYEDTFNYARAMRNLELYQAYKKLDFSSGMFRALRAYVYYKNKLKQPETIEAIGELEKKIMGERK